jgi:GTP-binding protein Era
VTAPAFRAGTAALLGWTNVGKSSLLNRLVGEKIAAVAEAPQTTRTRIVGARTVPGKGQVAFLDTPGFHKPRHRLNQAMVETSRRALETVDLAMLVVDAARGPDSGDADTATLLVRSGAARLGILNKIDRVHPKTQLLPMLRTMQEWGMEETVPVSALTGEGCDLLLHRVLELLPPGEPLFPLDYLTDQPERALAAEWIREKLLRLTREEVPHATAVSVERWHEREDGLLEIDAVILVEREGQKGIVIGKGGALLKQVGTEARAELERFFDARVGLRLWVKVREHWRDDGRALHELGLE